MAPTEPLLRNGATPIVIAHRGASTAAPENTMAAFHAAWDAGADWLETDVQPTMDGVPVLIHDDRADRTTDGTGPVRSFTRAALAELNAGHRFGAAFAGARVPTLSALLAETTGNRRILLEIKGPHTRDEVAVIVAAIRSAGATDRVLLQSFEVTALQHVRALSPDEPVGLLVTAVAGDPVAHCRQLGAACYNPNVRGIVAEPDLVRNLHAAGIATLPWTADRPQEWAALTAAGVDGIITNRPAELLAWQLTGGH